MLTPEDWHAIGVLIFAGIVTGMMVHRDREIRIAGRLLAAAAIGAKAVQTTLEYFTR